MLKGLIGYGMGRGQLRAWPYAYDSHGSDWSDARLITVLEGLDAAVHVEDAATGETLFDNRRFRELFGSRRFGGAYEPGGALDPRVTTNEPAE